VHVGQRVNMGQQVNVAQRVNAVIERCKIRAKSKTKAL
jgi:hypothetical protein